jgi:hypothetical protein
MPSTTRTQAKRTGAAARTTARKAERTFQQVLTASGYAVLGAGDLAVAKIRDASRTANEWPGRARTIGSKLPDTLREGFDDLTARGRRLTGQVADSAPTRKAKGQISTAASQTKAASTSVKKAVRAQGKAAEAAAEKVGATSRTRLEDRTVEELHDRAAELDIDGRSQMNKDDLIKAIRTAS